MKLECDLKKGMVLSDDEAEALPQAVFSFYEIRPSQIDLVDL